MKPEVTGYSAQNFARNLRTLRERRDWSQSKIAEMLGITPSAVNQWEAGKAIQRMPKLELLASIFGVSVTELLTELKDDNSTLRYEEVALIGNFRKLNAEGRAMVLKAVSVLAASDEYGVHDEK